MTRFEVVHRTDYRYGMAMTDGYTVAHLLPRPTPTQQVVSSELFVEPDADEFTEQSDMFGNRVVRVGIHRPHDHLVITSRSVVDVDAPVRPDDWGSDSMSCGEVADAVRRATGDLVCEIGPYSAVTSATPTLDEVVRFSADLLAADRPIVAAVRALSSRIFAEFRFDAEFSDVSTPIADVLQARRGVCQDFAHLMLACLRSHGLAGRYVSGYIETEPLPGQTKLAGSDASHAWCSVWSPDVGWFDVDPTNDQLPPQRHVTCAWGRDYFDVAPVRGVVIGPATTQSLWVGVDVNAVL